MRLTSLGWVTLVGAFLGLSACDLDSKTLAIRSGVPENAPEELVAEWGLGKSSTGRVVLPANFGDFPLVVDIFRASSKLPPLGEYKSEYDTVIYNQSVFDYLAKREFAVISLRGLPQRAYLVSAGIEKKVKRVLRSTPPGVYRLDPIMKVVDGMSTPFPWLKPVTAPSTLMYWGLWIYGGYFMHSTTHYSEIGRAASMGSIRQTFPDAMALYSDVAKYPAMIRIHAVNSKSAFARLRALTTVEWILPQLMRSRSQITAYERVHGPEITGFGHGWMSSVPGEEDAPVWPSCGAGDCFKTWGVVEPEGRR